MHSYLNVSVILNLLNEYFKSSIKSFQKSQRRQIFPFFLELEILSLYLEIVKGKMSEFQMFQFFLIHISV